MILEEYFRSKNDKNAYNSQYTEQSNRFSGTYIQVRNFIGELLHARSLKLVHSPFSFHIASQLLFYVRYAV